MEKSISHFVAVKWIGVLGWVIVSHAVLAKEPAATPQITLLVYNRAEVEPDTLRKANLVASRIFQNAGIEVAVIVDPPPSPPEKTDGNQPQFPPPLAFFVQILPPEMANRLRLPSTILGFAPGTPKDYGRNKVYVFNEVAAKIEREQSAARVSKTVSFNADRAQILGYAIAHEIGHVLLNLEAHKKRGIMQANWDRDALADIATGRLNFDPEEVASIQAEVVRRGIQQ